MTSSARPSKALTLEAIAMWLDLEHAVAAVAVAVSMTVAVFVIGTSFRVVLDVAISDSAVTVDVTMTVVSVLLGDVAPDVRLLMTSAGSM